MDTQDWARTIGGALTGYANDGVTNTNAARAVQVPAGTVNTGFGLGYIGSTTFGKIAVVGVGLVLVYLLLKKA